MTKNDKKLTLSIVRRFAYMYGGEHAIVDKYKDKSGVWVFVVARLKKEDRAELIESLDLHGYSFDYREIDGELELTNL